MKNLFRRFSCDESAQALVEYALILCLLSIMSLAAIKVFASAWQNKFNNLKKWRTGVPGIEP